MNERTVAVLGLAALATATLVALPDLADAQDLTPSGAIKGVCNGKALQNPHHSGEIAVLIAIDKQGDHKVYVCDKGPSGPGGPGKGKVAETAESDVPGYLVPGTVKLLPPSYRKLKEKNGDDPCIELGGGGSKTYYCW